MKIGLIDEHIWQDGAIKGSFSRLSIVKNKLVNQLKMNKELSEGVYIIPKQLKETEGYEKYIDCDFDVIYNNFAPKRFHIHTAADGQTSFIKEINDAFQKYNILVSVSIQNEVDEIDGHTYEYLVFLS